MLGIGYSVVLQCRRRRVVFYCASGVAVFIRGIILFLFLVHSTVPFPALLQVPMLPCKSSNL